VGLHTYIAISDDTMAGYYMDFQNGKHIFLWAGNRTSSMVTPVLYSTPICLSFWFTLPHKYSNLKVLVRRADGQLREVWSKEEHIIGWHEADLVIQEQIPFHVRQNTSLSLLTPDKQTLK